HTELDERNSVNDLCHQIVFVRFRDLATVEPARVEFFSVAKIVDKQFAVDLRSMHLSSAFPEQLRLFRRAKGEHMKLFADQLLLVAFADLLLNLHQLTAATLNCALGNFAVEMVRCRAFLV